MHFDDFLSDAKLHIKTTGREDSCSNAMVFPYEPTSYSVLERLAQEGWISKEDHLIDYGSGLGRVPIYLADRIGCRTTGVEMAVKYHEQALLNLEAYLGEHENHLIGFCNKKAQEYILPDTANRLFFFNPFHLKTFKLVMRNVLDSYRKNPRNIRMFFYYPQDAYISYLSGLSEVMFLDEIDCRDLFEEEDNRNRIMIFETPGEDECSE
ncbi:MAG: SAM-dependent methyltransferase [Lachnospiraceae bacterium]|nr:SAM-dependent methyltransferase [Lachnospiraceae bacterium]